MPQQSQKLQFVKKKHKHYEEEKDKSLVKYNYNDFLNASAHLTEKCTELVKGLCEGFMECAICSNTIYQKSALWNCRQCF